MREIFKAQVQVNILWLPAFFLDEEIRLGKPLFFQPGARRRLENVRKIPFKTGQAPAAKFSKMLDGRVIVEILKHDLLQILLMRVAEIEKEGFEIRPHLQYQRNGLIYLHRSHLFADRLTHLRVRDDGLEIPLQYAGRLQQNILRTVIPMLAGNLVLQRELLQTDFSGQSGTGLPPAPFHPADDKSAFDRKFDRQGDARERTVQTCTFCQTHKCKGTIHHIFA